MSHHQEPSQSQPPIHHNHHTPATYSAKNHHHRSCFRRSTSNFVVTKFLRQHNTTESWDFIGPTQNTKRRLKIEWDIIVGIFDTGITPKAESFSDHGLSPPPDKWKGSCLKSSNFYGCNKFVFGAGIT